jgi:hypothetical protein
METVHLCKRCAPLLERAELDTIGRLRAKLCAVCRARLTYARTRDRIGLSERERRLLAKYGASVVLLLVACGGSQFTGASSSSKTSTDDAGDAASSSGGEHGIGGELGAGGARTSTGGTSSSGGELGAGGARTSTGGTSSSGGELGAGGEHGSGGESDAGAACMPAHCPQCTGPVLGCCATPTLGGAARCGCPFQASGQVICGL